jgi:hypothetical protein
MNNTDTQNTNDLSIIDHVRLGVRFYHGFFSCLLHGLLQ